jgi:hypothetical protein
MKHKIGFGRNIWNYITNENVHENASTSPQSVSGWIHFIWAFVGTVINVLGPTKDGKCFISSGTINFSRLAAWN